MPSFALFQDKTTFFICMNFLGWAERGCPKERRAGETRQRAGLENRSWNESRHSGTNCAAVSILSSIIYVAFQLFFRRMSYEYVDVCWKRHQRYTLRGFGGFNSVPFFPSPLVSGQVIYRVWLQIQIRMICIAQSWSEDSTNGLIMSFIRNSSRKLLTEWNIRDYC